MSLQEENSGGFRDAIEHPVATEPDRTEQPTSGPWRTAALTMLKQRWGYDSFRNLQEEAVRAVLERRDSLVVLPTGGGKSLCYQLPALLRDGLAVVVSPLIALMKDQVDALTDLGIAAAAVNSSQSADEQREIARRVQSGELKILYVAPERMCTPRMLNFLAGCQLSFIAIDEAHCISSWGHQFRPEYRLLGQLRERFPEVDLHAYTATATEQVRTDIARQLNLQAPEELVGSFDRPNLTYRVIPRSDGRAQIKIVLDRFEGQAGIIYCISRRQVDDLTLYLQQSGYRAGGYHAGLEHDQRQRAQDDFLNERISIIVATVAFGMGIDKPNVRFVVHASATKSLENYQQETGRAGRDGLPAECYLFYGGQDFATWKLLQDKLDGEAARVASEQLQRKRQFCHSLECRHKALVEHFGQEFPAGNCGACDVCLNEVNEVTDALVISQKILSCVARVKERFGTDYVANVLVGSKEQKVIANGHHQLSTYGLLQAHSKKEIKDWISQLEAQECLEREPQYGSLLLTPTGRRVFKGEFQPRLARTQSKPRERVQLAELSPDETTLFERLRELRREIAIEKKVAPFIVFGDVTLIAMCRQRPSTVAALLEIPGVGGRKCEAYGSRFLERIGEVCRDLNLEQDCSAGADQRTASGSPAAGLAGLRSQGDEPRELSGVAREAADMFAAGASVEEVAEQLGRARSTVITYLQAAIEAGIIRGIDRWVDPDIIQTVSLVALESDTDRLKPIFEALDGKVPYDQIRLVMAYLKQVAEPR